MPLPEPVTRSPGSIKLLYGDAIVRHSSGVRLVAGTVITDLTTMRILATDYATIFAGALGIAEQVTGWRISDPSGATLFEESFPAPFPGVIDNPAYTPSFSCSLTLIGKGAATVIGEKAGTARLVVYPGLFASNGDKPRRVSISLHPELGAVREFLTITPALGADFYGQKVTWHDFVDIQLNSHWQQKEGF